MEWGSQRFLTVMIEQHAGKPCVTTYDPQRHRGSQYGFALLDTYLATEQEPLPPLPEDIDSEVMAAWNLPLTADQVRQLREVRGKEGDDLGYDKYDTSYDYYFPRFYRVLFGGDFDKMISVCRRQTWRRKVRSYVVSEVQEYEAKHGPILLDE